MSITLIILMVKPPIGQLSTTIHLLNLLSHTRRPPLQATASPKPNSLINDRTLLSFLNEFNSLMNPLLSLLTTVLDHLLKFLAHNSQNKNKTIKKSSNISGRLIFFRGIICKDRSNSTTRKSVF